MCCCRESTNLQSNGHELWCCREENQPFFAGKTWRCLMGACALGFVLFLILGSLSLAGHISLSTTTTNTFMCIGPLGIAATIAAIVIFYIRGETCRSLFLTDRI